MKTFDFKGNAITNNYTLSDYFSTIYTKMFIGLIITALVSYMLPLALQDCSLQSYITIKL